MLRTLSGVIAMFIRTLEVTGVGVAMRAMRNPLDSWDLGDTEDGYMGLADAALAKKLIKAGKSDRKFLRMINVSFDVKGPIYWWSEFDTYKVGVTRLSCSTMHTLGKRKLTHEDFEEGVVNHYVLEEINSIIGTTLDGDGKRSASVIRRLKMLLPSGFLQQATIATNYEAVINMYMDRRNHRLPEWSETFCGWVKSLPYMHWMLEAAERSNNG